jgi:stage II sporulation protein D
MFDVRRERGTFVFDGRGFGHGVGLCQAGALWRLRAGASPASVLQRYFPNTTLLAVDN